MKTETLTKTETLVREILVESTGGNIVDSGGAYGRHWKRNQSSPPWQHPAIRYDADRSVDGFTQFDLTFNVYHYLTEMFEVDEHVQNVLDTYDRLTGKTKDTIELARTVAEMLTKSEREKYEDFEKHTEFYTYNEVYWNLSQDLHVQLLRYADRWAGRLWIVNVHQGCDARWGFSRPLALRPKYEDYVMPEASVDFTPKEPDFDKHILFDYRSGEWISLDGTCGEEEFGKCLDACELKDGKLFYNGVEIQVYENYSH